MQKKWDIVKVEIDQVIVSDEEFKQRLEEWGEVVYRYFCQLSESQMEVPETFLKRTGTYDS